MTKKIDGLLVILGPTATGKTDLAFEMAKKLDGEIVACDSKQVYKGLDISTGKLPSGISNFQFLISNGKYKKNKGYWDVDGVKFWMYDLVEPSAQYSVKDYVDKAQGIIDEIRGRSKLPIIVGGTGLYLKGLLEGFDNLEVGIDIDLRAELQKKSLVDLQNLLKEKSSARWESLNNSDRNNPRRLLRLIEIILSNPYANTRSKSDSIGKKYDVLKIGLNAPKKFLYQKIDARVFDWIKDGLIEEAKAVKSLGIDLRKLGLEYSCLASFLEGKTDKDRLIYCMQTKTRQYAKRQVTWFKKEKEVNWLDVTEKNWQVKVERLVLDWYN